MEWRAAGEIGVYVKEVEFGRREMTSEGAILSTLKCSVGSPIQAGTTKKFVSQRTISEAAPNASTCPFFRDRLGRFNIGG
jgi:hypothetical protein